MRGFFIYDTDKRSFLKEDVTFNFLIIWHNKVLGSEGKIGTVGKPESRLFYLDLLS